MKIKLSVLLSILFLSASLAQSGSKHDMKPITGSAELEAVKKLAGAWEGTHQMEGKSMPATVEYKVTSNGSAVLETLAAGTPHEMVSVYHDERGKLTMTHYCAVGNQPVMDLKKSGNGVFEFKFAKKKNTLDRKKEAHMHGLRMTMVSENKLKHEWQYYEDGKKSQTTVMEFERK